VDAVTLVVGYLLRIGTEIMAQAKAEKIELLAKGLKAGQTTSSSAGETLTGHTSMVMQAFKAMFGSREEPTHLARCWLRFFKLPLECFDSFWLHVLVACALHDLGKANEDFQQLVRHTLSGAQLIRHEHLSGLLLCLPQAQSWLKEIKGLDLWVVFSAVVGHHLKVKYESFACAQTDRSLLKIYPEGIQAIFRLLAHELKLETPDLKVPELWNTNDSGIGQSIEDLKTEQIEGALRHFEKSLKQDSAKSAFLNAVRTALILADSAGSGLSREMREEKKLAQAITIWLQDVFSEHSIQRGCDIETHVINKRIEQIKANGKPFKWGDFQMAAADLPERALLLAACGSGKTLAAWKWIQAQLDQQPKSRVIFLYPTRATATEGFRDYVSWAPEADAALVHGTSAYELDGLFENPQSPQDERFGKDFTTQERLFALGYWPRRIFSATVDQFLGFMQYVYGSVCLLPLLVDSVVVIDEVHSFDHALFSALKQFLLHFDIPVLCMTASLPPERQKQLKDCGLEIFPTDTAQFINLQTLADLERYQIHRLAEPEAAYDVVQRGLQAGKRILWVVNTVDRCQQLARELNAICYHSRFKLKDRKYWHHQVVKAFQQKDQPQLAITTQVCEMSLDLDADILITEIAPITALIQRMGRCNRQAREAGGPLGQVYVYPPEKSLPYREEDLAGVELFLNELNGRAVSQSELERGLNQHGLQAPKIDRYSAFLQSGPWAFSADHHLRDSLDLSVQAVLDTDIDMFLGKKRRKEPVDGLVLPAPKKMASKDTRLDRLFYQKVSAEHYYQQYGLIKPGMEANV